MRSALILLAGLLGGVVPAFAQTAPPSIEDSIIVTAGLERQSEDEAPVAVTVITGEEIENRQATQVVEVLRTVAGLAVAQSGSAGKAASLFVRGADSNQTLVLWNGLRLNDPYFGGFDWAFLPTEGVERVEVTRGPFSALYGSDAIAGVVHVMGGPRDGIGARLEAGEDGYGRVSLAAGQSLDNVRFDLTGHLRQGDGQFANDFFDSEELLARAEWDLGDSATLGILARANNSDIGIPFSGVEPRLQRRQESETREIALPFRARTGQWTIDAALSQTTLDLAFEDPEDDFSRSDTDGERLRLRTVASRDLGEGFWLAFGGEWHEEEVTASSNFGVDLDGDTRSAWALFAQVHKAWGPVAVELGVRQDDDEFFGTQTSPKLGVVASLSSEWRVHASYGEGFRAPSLGELFFPFSGNVELRPETSESFELGLAWSDGRWRAGLTGFDTRQDDLIDFEFASFTFQNIGRAESRGVELEAGYDGELASVRLAATRLEAEDRDTGLPLLRRPETSASLVLNLRPGRWGVTLVGRYVGERPDVDPVTFARRDNPSYTVADLMLEWRASGSVKPYLRLENAADETYEEALGFPAPGRTFIGGIAFSR